MSQPGHVLVVIKNADLADLAANRISASGAIICSLANYYEQ